MLYNMYINLEIYKMPLQSELTILPSNPSHDMDFGTVFNHCLEAFHTNGSYSEISFNNEKYINKKINLEFCPLIKGTLYGHYPLYVPTFVDDGEYTRRSPFFHFSTLVEENIEDAKTALTIILDKDEHAQTLLITVAICLIQKGYRAFINPDNTTPSTRIEVTKESVAKHVAKNTGFIH